MVHILGRYDDKVSNVVVLMPTPKAMKIVRKPVVLRGTPCRHAGHFDAVFPLPDDGQCPAKSAVGPATADEYCRDSRSASITVTGFEDDGLFREQGTTASAHHDQGHNKQQCVDDGFANNLHSLRRRPFLPLDQMGDSQEKRRFPLRGNGSYSRALRR